MVIGLTKKSSDLEVNPIRTDNELSVFLFFSTIPSKEIYMPCWYAALERERVAEPPPPAQLAPNEREEAVYENYLKVLQRTAEIVNELLESQAIRIEQVQRPAKIRQTQPGQQVIKITFGNEALSPSAPKEELEQAAYVQRLFDSAITAGKRTLAEELEEHGKEEGAEITDSDRAYAIGNQTLDPNISWQQDAIVEGAQLFLMQTQQQSAPIIEGGQKQQQVTTRSPRRQYQHL